MKSGLYKTCSLKWLFFCALAVIVVSCIAVHRHVSAEEQIKQGEDVFNSVESIRIRDPLAVMLGATEKGGVFSFSYMDAVKCAGHSCPAVAGAFKSIHLALKHLYGEEIPVRGNIRVVFKGGVDFKVNGPISQIVTLVTGAAAENGFKGLGAGGKFSRHNLLVFDKDSAPDPKSVCSMTFQRVDTDKAVEITYCVSAVPVDERVDKLMPLAISGKASDEELKQFGNIWQERVKTILLNPPEGTFLVKEIKK